MNLGTVLLLTFLGIALAVPAQPQDKWIVAYKDREISEAQKAAKRAEFTAKSAADILSKNMSKVLKREIPTAPWSEAKGDLVFLITEAQFAPDDVRKQFTGKALDAFVVRYPCEMDGRTVCLLAGNDNKAYDFPVYYFLRNLMGMEWVGPTELGEAYQEQPGWQMPKKIDVLENPDYQHRAFQIYEDMNPHAWFIRENEEDGSRMMFHHSMMKVYDPLKYGDRPELFSYFEGKRHPPAPGSRAQWQPCTSNPETVQIAVDYGVQYLKDNPDKLSFGLSVNDGAGFCLCDKCRAQDPPAAWEYGNPRLTDRYAKYYNQVIEGVLKENPDAWMAVLGYSRLKTPPIETKLNSRICVFNCVDNTNPFPDMAERQKMWKAAGATPALYFRVGDYGFLTVQHYAHALGDIIKLTHDLGGFGFYTETVQNWAASGPRLYVIANKLWDADANVDDLLAKYMKLAFGAEAAPAVGAYFDRWEQIWERRTPKYYRYDTTNSQKDYDQLDQIRREDLAAMDEALERAQAASASVKEKKRLEYVVTYYKWLRLNADQYLLASEFRDPSWGAKRSSEDILKQAVRGLAITNEFDRMTNEVILKDRTGWLWQQRIKDQIEIYLPFDGEVRAGVLAVYKSAIDDAFGRITERLLGKQSKEEVAAYWQEQSRKNPVLAPWAITQAHLLSKGAGENLFVNGDLERGTPGDPPKIEGWELPKGGLHDKPVFAWEPDSGREGGRAIAVGRGHDGGIAQQIQIDAGKRYRFSVWYKTTENLNPTVRFFITGLPLTRVPVPIEPAKGKWRQYALSFSGSDLIGYEEQTRKARALGGMNSTRESIKKMEDSLHNLQSVEPGSKFMPDLLDNLEKTRQKLKDLETQAQEAPNLPDSTKARIQLSAYTLDKGEWMWFDDVELREISR